MTVLSPFAAFAAATVGLVIGMAFCAICWFLLAAIWELLTWRAPLVRLPKK